MPLYCSVVHCARGLSLNHDGSKARMYSSQHAEECMMNVNSKHFAYAECKGRSRFNHEEGSKTAMYCRKHAEEVMVDVVNKRCPHAHGRIQRPSFYDERSKSAVYYKEHAEEGEVDVCSKRCAPMKGARDGRVGGTGRARSRGILQTRRLPHGRARDQLKTHSSRCQELRCADAVGDGQPATAESLRQACCSESRRRLRTRPTRSSYGFIFLFLSGLGRAQTPLNRRWADRNRWRR